MRRVLMVDSGRYRNERSAALHCYMGHDGIAPSELLETTRAQLARYDTVAHRRGGVTRVERRNGFLAAVDGEEVHARALLVATGVVDELPPVPRIARQLIDGAEFPPDVLKVIREAFDDAWVELAPEVGTDLDAIDTARISLATITLSIAAQGHIDRLGLKSAAMEAFRLKHRPT